MPGGLQEVLRPSVLPQGDRIHNGKIEEYRKKYRRNTGEIQKPLSRSLN